MLQAAKVEAVVMSGPSANRRFAAGTRARLFSAEQLQPFKDQSLSDYLQRAGAVYIKEFGQGMGAYISVRGTSASHTSVHWNGMGVEVPTMGQTDFSHLPLFFFDAMSLHIGGGSALYGNGSIGGSVQLETLPLWRHGVHGEVRLGAGSFDRYVAGATVRWSGNRWESRTSVLYSCAQNRFFFTNNTRAGKPQERQQHASTRNQGLLQELYKKVGAADQFSLHLWYIDVDRDIQPSVSNNDRPETWSAIHDKNVKISGVYRGSTTRFKYTAQAGYAHDYEAYQKDIIEAGRILFSADGQYTWSRFTAKGGGNTTFVHPWGKAFEAAVQEWRSDIYGLLLWKPVPSLTANAGIRQSFVSNLSLLPDPFIGAQWTFLQSGAHRLTLRGAFSQSHKIPTLNDRYWGGANVYLRAERATTIESGIDYEAPTGPWHWTVNGTVYQSNVTDWIRWFPAGVVWRPQNIPEVDAWGVEASFRLQGAVKEVQLSADAHWAYTSVTVKKSLWDLDPGVGRQLAYQPYHCFSAVLSANYRAISLELQSRYTGKRTTNDIHDILPGYALWNVHISYTCRWGGQAGTLYFMVNNLLNKDYQNVKFYAMPGRNYMINMQYQF